MQFENTEVQGNDGTKRRASMIKCDCGNNSFIIFGLDGDDHPHLQCTKCNTSYCYGGKHD